MAESYAVWEEKQTEKLKTALKELGGGKNKICETLEAKKILGQVGDSVDCPVARYLQKVFKNADSVVVDHDEISISLPKGTITVVPPKVVSSFITEFDEAEYLKHLEDNEEAE